MTRLALLLFAGLALAGCGGRAPSAADRANVALLDRLPVYVGASGSTTSTSREGSSSFAVRDARLPASARPAAVVDWYASKLAARGWRIVGKTDTGLRALRHGASVDMGVRGRTVEIVADAEGAPV